MENKDIVRKNSVIQVGEKYPEWEACLMYVQEVKEWGVLAGMKIPQNGTAYLRLKHDEYFLVGQSAYEEA